MQPNACIAQVIIDHDSHHVAVETANSHSYPGLPCKVRTAVCLVLLMHNNVNVCVSQAVVSHSVVLGLLYFIQPYHTHVDLSAEVVSHVCNDA